METYEKIKELRLKNGLSQEDLAFKVGYSDRSSIAKVESGQVDLTQSKIYAFAEALHVSPAQLMGIKEDSSLPDNILPMPKMRKVPLLGTIACGKPILAAENLDGEVDIPDHIHADFALRCKGDSMIGADIRDGDVVYIRQQDTVDDGQIAAVLIEDEATLKRFYYDNQTSIVTLVAENPSIKPMIYHGETLNHIRVLGLAVGLTRVII